MELEEEAGVRADELIGKPTLLAVVRDSFLAQPEAIWQWESAVELEEVAAQLNGREHQGAVIVEKGSVPSATWEVMTPVAREAWRQWRRQ